jgi:hypothetical protein
MTARTAATESGKNNSSRGTRNTTRYPAIVIAVNCISTTIPVQLYQLVIVIAINYTSWYTYRVLRIPA